MIRSIAEECGVRDLNRIKPGIAEATRAILRRVPDRIYVQRRDDPDVAHICLLADKAGVRVIERNMRTYRAITIIKDRSEEHTSELQSLMRISYAVFCLKKKKQQSKH